MILTFNNKWLEVRDKTLNAIPTRPTYYITVTTDGNGSASSDKNYGHTGDTVNLSNTPASHYAFDHYTVNGAYTTNSSFTLQQDTNVVAYFSYNYDTNDWYYDDQYTTVKVQNRTLEHGCSMLVAHQRYTANPDPKYNQRQAWSNYGVCRCKFTVSNGNAGVGWAIDTLPNVTPDEIIWRNDGTARSNYNVALLIDFVQKKAYTYANNSVVSTQNVNLNANGTFLSVHPQSATALSMAYDETLTQLSMKIFTDYTDAMRFAQFQ